MSDDGPAGREIWFSHHLAEVVETFRVIRRRPEVLLSGVFLAGFLALSLVLVSLLVGLLYVGTTFTTGGHVAEVLLEPAVAIFVFFALLPFGFAIIMPLALSGTHAVIDETLDRTDPPSWRSLRDPLAVTATFVRSSRHRYTQLAIASFLFVILTMLTWVLLFGVLLAGVTIVQFVAYATTDSWQFLTVEQTYLVALKLAEVAVVLAVIPWHFYAISILRDETGPAESLRYSAGFCLAQPRLLIGTYVGPLVIFLLVIELSFWPILWISNQMAASTPWVVLHLFFLCFAVVYHVVFYRRCVTGGPRAAEMAETTTSRAAPDYRMGLRRTALVVLLLSGLALGAFSVRAADYRPAYEPPTDPVDEADSPDQIVERGLDFLEVVNHRARHRIYGTNETTGEMEQIAQGWQSYDHRDREFLLYGEVGVPHTTEYRSPSERAIVYGPDSPEDLTEEEIEHVRVAAGPALLDLEMDEIPRLSIPVLRHSDWVVGNRSDGEVTVRPDSRDSLIQTYEDISLVPENTLEAVVHPGDENRLLLTVDASTGRVQRVDVAWEYDVHNRTNGSIMDSEREQIVSRYDRYGEDVVERPPGEYEPANPTLEPVFPWHHRVLELVWRILYY